MSDIPTFNERKRGGAADEGQSRRDSAPKRPAVPVGLSSADKRLRRELLNQFTTLAMVFAARGDMHCAQVILEGSENLVDSWLWLAKRHPSVRKWLEGMLTGQGYFALVTSTLGIALPIMAHHGLAPKALGALFAPASVGGVGGLDGVRGLGAVSGLGQQYTNGVGLDGVGE
jgi:hypothetical protein